MWVIFENRSIGKTLKKAPSEVVVRYEAWKRTVELLGPVGLKKVRGFRDEALKGDWKGFRSSRLNKQWRVIYKVEGKQFEVYVMDVSPHKY